jgi:hypothetical protein
MFFFFIACFLTCAALAAEIEQQEGEVEQLAAKMEEGQGYLLAYDGRLKDARRREDELDDLLRRAADRVCVWVDMERKERKKEKNCVYFYGLHINYFSFISFLFFFSFF